MSLRGECEQNARCGRVVEASRLYFVCDVDARLPDLVSEVGVEGQSRGEGRTVLERETRVEPALPQKQVEGEILNIHVHIMQAYICIST